jgi:hypothetical protein
MMFRYRAQLEGQVESLLGEKENLAKRLELLRSKLDAATDDKNRQGKLIDINNFSVLYFSVLMGMLMCAIHWNYFQQKKNLP